MKIEFKRTTESSSFYSPLEDFDRVTTEVEVREDPLTGDQTRIVPNSFLKPETDPDIRAAVDEDDSCFFCPDAVGSVTPKYDDFVGFDRGSVGEATSFPNLNPYGAYSNVVALTSRHYLPLAEFSSAIFEDGLEASIQYINKVFEMDSDMAVASVNMNYLRPAGSSIVHPHMQSLVSEGGTNYFRRLEDAYNEIEKPFWPQLIAGNRDDGRFIGTTGSCEWFAPFAPRHHWHVRGICDRGSIPAEDDPVISELAMGITNVLTYYGKIGLNSFNFACYMSKGFPEFPILIDIVGRSVFEEFYWSDSPFFTILHDQAVIDTPPEEYAEPVSEQF